MSDENDPFGDLDKIEMDRWKKTTPQSRATERALRKAQRAAQMTTYPHLRCYSMSEEEEDAAAEWWDEHPCGMRGRYRGAIGGGSSVLFSPTSIGTVVVLKCCCGAEKDVTDYSRW